MDEDLFAELEDKYGIQGYDNSSVIVSYDVFKGLAEKAEKYDTMVYLKNEIKTELEKTQMAYRDHVAKLQSSLEDVKKWKFRIGLRFEPSQDEAHIDRHDLNELATILGLRVTVEGN